MKKELILIMIVALLFLIGLFSFILKDVPSDTFNLDQVFYEPISNFVLAENEESSYVENKNIGLKIIVPETWEVKRIEGIGIDGNGVEEGAIAIYSPDSEVDEKTHLASKGCGVSIRYEKRPGEIQYKILSNMIDNLRTGEDKDGYKLINVSGKDGLYEIVIEEENVGQAIMVSVPVRENVYIFETVIPTIEKERCEKEFSDFLKTVEISKQ